VPRISPRCVAATDQRSATPRLAATRPRPRSDRSWSTDRRLRETEVEDLDAVAELDVGGLEVAVHDALLVRGVEAVRDLEKDLETLGERQRPRLMRSASVSPSTTSITRKRRRVAGAVCAPAAPSGARSPRRRGGPAPRLASSNP
jgi:hypothetical protein